MRLIDADALIEDFNKLNEWIDIDEEAEIVSLINNAPTVQAKPRTGEWIEVEVFPEVYDIEGVKTWGSEMQCDQCGFKHIAIEGRITQYNFCPNCGADMRGEKNVNFEK